MRDKNQMAVGDIIEVSDYYQTNYRYRLEAPAGKNFDAGFNPHFTPKEMLKLGVFEGKYCNDCIDEFPKIWFDGAKISDMPNPALN